MTPCDYNRLRELHENMVDWICEHIKNDEDLFHALYGRCGFAPSELDPEVECRVYKFYQALPPKERFENKIKAEFAEFQSYWRTLSADELVDISDKISIVCSLARDLPETLTEEQAAYFNMYQEPLEAISDTVMRNNNYAHNAAFIGQVIQTMYDNGDGGAYYDMEEEYYDNDDVVEEPKM